MKNKYICINLKYFYTLYLYNNKKAICFVSFTFSLLSILLRDICAQILEFSIHTNQRYKSFFTKKAQRNKLKNFELIETFPEL